MSESWDRVSIFNNYLQKVYSCNIYSLGVMSKLICSHGRLLASTKDMTLIQLWPCWWRWYTVIWVVVDGQFIGKQVQFEGSLKAGSLTESDSHIREKFPHAERAFFFSKMLKVVVLSLSKTIHSIAIKCNPLTLTPFFHFMFLPYLTWND